jgi:hypothetical protein
MTETKDALVAVRAAAQVLALGVALPERPASRVLMEKLRATHAARATPQAAFLEGLRDRLAAAFKDGHARATRRDLQDAPWILWQGTPAGAAIPGLLDAVFTQAVGASRTARNLIEAWLRDFAPDAPTVAAAGQAIQRLLPVHPDHRLDVWRSAQRRLDLFDAQRGPAKLARALMQGTEPVDAILASCGFDDAIRASGGYMRATVAALLAAIPAMLRSDFASRSLQRCLRVLAPGGTLRFGTELRGAIGRALLAPWLDGGPPPASAERDAVRGFLLQQLGDPRLRASNWTALGDKAIALMRSWVARASVKAFYQLIAERGLDGQWRYRSAFWAACLERGAIDDAWIVLGRNAGTIRDLGDAYAVLADGGDQAALLLRVGPLALCEWSHNGKLHAWSIESRNAPKLQRRAYTREALSAKGLAFPPNAKYGTYGASDGTGLSQVNADRDYWQGSAAALLASRAGIALTDADWQPR